MKRYVLTRIGHNTDSGELEAKQSDIYPDHQSANAAMQRQFDLEVDDTDTIFGKDDTEAGHFWIDRGDETTHWFITEVETF